MTGNTPDKAPFSSDRVLLYNVEPWNGLGFGVPNFGNDFGTLNKAAHSLADFIGQCQLLVMTHVDAMRTAYPSINTVMRLGKMCNRIRSVLSNRNKTASDLRLEENHATADPHQRRDCWGLMRSCAPNWSH